MYSRVAALCRADDFIWQRQTTRVTSSSAILISPADIYRRLIYANDGHAALRASSLFLMSLETHDACTLCGVLLGYF
jgi:hypothetical protein